MIVIVILVMVVAVALVATANANRQSAFVKDYEQSYYSAESAAMAATELFRAKVSELLADENSSAQSGLFFSTNQADGFDIVDYVQKGLQSILDDVMASPALQQLLQDDDLFKDKILSWTVSVLPFDDGVTVNPGGAYALTNVIVGITTGTDARQSTVNIHYVGEMGASGAASGGSLLDAEDKFNEIRGIMGDRDRFFEMGGQIVTGIDPNDSKIDYLPGGGSAVTDENLYMQVGGGVTHQSPMFSSATINNNVTRNIYVSPGQGLIMQSFFELQFSQLENVFIEADPVNFGNKWYENSGGLILQSTARTITFETRPSFLTFTGNVHFDGRHEGELHEFIRIPGVLEFYPVYSYANPNVMFGHIDTRQMQADGKYNYFDFNDYDEYYQPLGSNFFIGGRMLIDCGNTTGGNIHFINNGRFAVKRGIECIFPAGTQLKGNSVYLSETTIKIDSDGDLAIGEKSGGYMGKGRAPQFISNGNIEISYAPGSKIELYGVFGTLGEYRGPNFVDDPNVEVAGLIYAEKGYFDQNGSQFFVPQDFWDNPELGHTLPAGAEYLDTSFFSQGFSITSDRIVNIVEN